MPDGEGTRSSAPSGLRVKPERTSTARRLIPRSEASCPLPETCSEDARQEGNPLTINPAPAATKSLRFMVCPSIYLPASLRSNADIPTLNTSAVTSQDAGIAIPMAFARRRSSSTSGDYFGCDRSMLETLYHTMLHEPSL